MEKIFTPLIGGIIIGLATTIMLIFKGRVTGISGIVNGTLEKVKKENVWRYSFILGLLSGGIFMLLFFPEYFKYQLKFSYAESITAGLLVGFGTLLGNGCTSGHGVCGLSRLSSRSFVATLTFMTVALLTVFVRGL